MSYLDALKAAQAENSEKHALPPTAKTAQTRLRQFRQYPLEPVLPEFRDASAPEPPLEPAPKDRLCYQCAHLAKSPYGYPWGLCVGHENRIQHRTSEPAKFGCGAFEPKEVRHESA